MTARDLFFARDDSVRAPWRVALFLAATAAAIIVVLGSVYPAATAIGRWLGFRPILHHWLFMLALLGGHALMFYWIKRDSWSMVGLHRAAARPKVLAEGWAIGMLAIGVPTALVLAAGWLSAEPSPGGSWLLSSLGLLIYLAPAAFWEELLIHGYPFAVIRQAAGGPAALVVTSLIFGFLHARNPGASLQSITQVVFAGVWLGGVLLASGSLYAAWMAHLAWNWVLAAVFHTSVSGLPFAAPNYRLVDAGPDWATGGVWGPEGGLGATLGMALALFFLFTRRRREEIQS